MHADPDARPSRRQIARDLMVFQVKLWLEGFKDVVLVPLSLAAAIIDIVRRPASRGAMYSVKQAGRRFEQWIDLYGEGEKRDEGASSSSSKSDAPRSITDLPAPPRPKAQRSSTSAHRD